MVAHRDALLTNSQLCHTVAMFGLSKDELKILKKLSTPHKIQDFLDTIPQNHEEAGDTCRSPRAVLRDKKAHCIEGALLAATALWLHGKTPLLLDLKTTNDDFDHVVALYKEGEYWGAISKTNHAVLRFRDPIYRTVRERARSYFHEYFMATNRKKTLRSYSHPFLLTPLGITWITVEENLWNIAEALDKSPHFKIIPKGYEKHLRPASVVERKAANIPEWKKGERII
jgi:hypothetical protein